MGLMHVELEGNGKVHIAGLIFCLVRIFDVPLQTINDAVQTFALPVSRGHRPPPFLSSNTEGTADLTPKDDASVGWTAMQVMSFMVYGRAMLLPILPTGVLQHRIWKCFELHTQYFSILLQTSFSRADIVQLDKLIYTQQEMFLAIPQYSQLWRPKNHYAQHFPIDIINFGPPTFYSELKYEMRHQRIKRDAQDGNFKAVDYTICRQDGMRLALDLAEGRNLEAVRSHLEPELMETCKKGDDQYIDLLYDSGLLPAGASIDVVWSSTLHVTETVSICTNSWVLAAAADLPSCLCQPFAFFSVPDDAIFVVLSVYKGAASESVSWGAYQALSTSLKEPTHTAVYGLNDVVFTPLHSISGTDKDGVVRFIRIV